MNALLILKPDVIQHSITIKTQLKENGFKLLNEIKTKLTPEQATDFYQHLLDTPKFNELIAYVTSGPIIAFHLQKDKIYEDLNFFIGPEENAYAKEHFKKSLRAVYGTDTIVNGFHFSSDVETASREIQFFFPRFLTNLPSLDHAHLFLQDAIYPTLVMGLTALCKEKPQDPVAWLGDWLLNKNPNKPVIEEP
ncbi:nucleoside diphosphate kinase [Globomyces pollinis-pini]|nr:nucleoside diphosphate kinase [Globomyces pollinis-pini]